MVRKVLVAVGLIWGVCAWAQCPRGSLVSLQVTCSCTGSRVTANGCTGPNQTGDGCIDNGFQLPCGGGCVIGQGQGCFPGGPKLKVPLLSKSLSSDIETFFAKQPGLTVATSGNDDGAFAKWLAETSHRRVQTLKEN